jgi:hypothetical protein
MPNVLNAGNGVKQLIWTRVIGISVYRRTSEGWRANCDSCATVAIKNNDLFSFDNFGRLGSAH